MKHLSRRIQNGATPPAVAGYYEDGTIPWFGPSSLSNEIIGEPVRFVTEAAIADGKARRIVGPAILLTVIGASAGRMGVLIGEGTTNQQITAFELKTDRLLAEFAVGQLRAAQHFIRETASTATIPIVKSTTIEKLSVALPAVNEQIEIITALKDETATLDRAIATARAEIDLLREYRTRLVGDVVTGKRDVRAAAAALPDITDDTPLPDLLAGDSEVADDIGADFGGDQEAA